MAAQAKVGQRKFYVRKQSGKRAYKQGADGQYIKNAEGTLRIVVDAYGVYDRSSGVVEGELDHDTAVRKCIEMNERYEANERAHRERAEKEMSRRDAMTEVERDIEDTERAISSVKYSVKRETSDFYDDVASVGASLIDFGGRIQKLAEQCREANQTDPQRLAGNPLWCLAQLQQLLTWGAQKTGTQRATEDALRIQEYQQELAEMEAKLSALKAQRRGEQEEIAKVS